MEASVQVLFGQNYTCRQDLVHVFFSDNYKDLYKGLKKFKSSSNSPSFREHFIGLFRLFLLCLSLIRSRFSTSKIKRPSKGSNLTISRCRFDLELKISDNLHSVLLKTNWSRLYLTKSTISSSKRKSNPYLHWKNTFIKWINFTLVLDIWTRTICVSSKSLGHFTQFSSVNVNASF